MSIAAVAVALTLLPAAPAELEYGPETTVITEPRRDDGTIDYVAALNARLREGVTPANNAAVEVMLTLDRRDFDAEMQAWYADVLDRMGVEQPVEAPMFVPFENRGGLGELSEFEIQEMYAEATQRPWAVDEFPIIAEWLETNRDVLALIEKASRKDHFYVPLSSPGDERENLNQVLLPHLAYLREVSRAFGIRATQSLAEGDTDRAWRDVVTIHRLARLCGREPVLISKLVASAMSAFATDVTSRIAASDELISVAASRMITSFRELDPLPSIAPALDLGERFVGLDSAQDLDALFEVVLSLSPAKIKSNPLLKLVRVDYDPNATMRAINEFYDDCVQMASRESYSIVAEQSATFDAEIERRCERGRATTNPLRFADLPKRERQLAVTDMVIGLIAPAVTKAIQVDWTARAQEDLALVALALGGYHAELGSFPDELDQLAPRFFEEIPPDRFANQPLMYRVEGDTAVIWSVGVDLEDDGGDAEDDLVVRLVRGNRD